MAMLLLRRYEFSVVTSVTHGPRCGFKLRNGCNARCDERLIAAAICRMKSENANRRRNTGGFEK
jgi:hypothetical protein